MPFKAALSVQKCKTIAICGMDMDKDSVDSYIVSMLDYKIISQSQSQQGVEGRGGEGKPTDIQTDRQTDIVVKGFIYV